MVGRIVTAVAVILAPTTLLSFATVFETGWAQKWAQLAEWPHSLFSFNDSGPRTTSLHSACGGAGGCAAWVVRCEAAKAMGEGRGARAQGKFT